MVLGSWILTQLANGRPFVGDLPDTTTSSPRKNKSYLSIYDSCAILSSISSEVFVECELQLFPGNHILEEKVVYAHGQFSVITATNEDKPCLQIEIHWFVVMDMIDPLSEDTPEGLRTSVTLSGQVMSTADTSGSAADKFFMLEVSDYIRDHIQTFNIRFVKFPSLLGQFLTGLCRCRLNRTTSKCWENTTVPIQGTTVLVSGYLEGEDAGVLLVEVETMQCYDFRCTNEFKFRTPTIC